MNELDSKDRQLIALLKQDGRASVTVLAAKLGVSRATVQSRMDRLVQTGVISRFTVDLASTGEQDVIRAVMMIEIEGNLEKGITRRLRQMPEITDSYTTNGKWDLVTVIETPSLPEFDQILREIRQIRGVRNSETCLLLDRTKG